MKNKPKKKKKILIMLAVLFCVTAGFLIGAPAVLRKNLTALALEEIPDVDLTEIADGVYTGSCTVLPVSAEVKVTVKDHVITEIGLVRHFNGQGSAAEILPEKVVEAQSLGVDIVSGATYSSKVILKAVRNALS